MEIEVRAAVSRRQLNKVINTSWVQRHALVDSEVGLLMLRHKLVIILSLEWSGCQHAFRRNSLQRPQASRWFHTGSRQALLQVDALLDFNLGGLHVTKRSGHNQLAGPVAFCTVLFGPRAFMRPAADIEEVEYALFVASKIATLKCSVHVSVAKLGVGEK